MTQISYSILMMYSFIYYISSRRFWLRFCLTVSSQRFSLWKRLMKCHFARIKTTLINHSSFLLLHTNSNSLFICHSLSLSLLDSLFFVSIYIKLNCSCIVGILPLYRRSALLYLQTGANGRRC